MKRNKDTLLGIFLLSLSLITYEIGLTRLFSAIFYYHYAFLVVSFSVLGLGLGGYLLHLTRHNDAKWIAWLQKGYGLVYLGTLSSLYFLPFLKSLVTYIILGTIPFLLGGYLLAYYFKQKDLEIGKLYFADLLGSTVGLGVILFAFQGLGVFPSLVLMTGLAFLSTFFLEKKGWSRGLLALLAVLMLGTLLIPGLEGWGNRAFQPFYTSPYSTMQGKESEYVHWDGFARTDVYSSDQREKVILLDGSAAAPITQFSGDLQEIERKKKWIGYLPFELVGGEKALLIGPGGGEDILHSFLAGMQDVTAVEINPGSVKAVGEMAEFSGDLYNDPRVTTYIQDGRNFVEQSTETFDHIYLSVVMTNVAEAGGKVLVENYIYTQEAIREYLNDLTDDGYVTFLMHQQSDMLRLLSTVVDLLQRDGASVDEIMQRLVVYFDPKIKHGDHEMMMYPVLMLKKTPFSQSEARPFHDRVMKQGYKFLAMPYFHEHPLFRKMASGEYSYQVFQEHLGYNIRPVTDQHPFIYQAQPGVPQYLKLLLLVIVVGLIMAYGYAGVAFSATQQVGQKLSYFVTLGFGFMMIEIVMMQLFAVYLGYPILTFVTVLGTLLFSSGLGSYFSEKVAEKVPPLLVVAGYGLLLSLGLPTLVQLTIHLSLAVKIGLIFILLAPMGFFMGMGFPMGIRRLKEAGQEEMIPLIWAMNGLASVGGSILSITVALLSNFQVVSLIGVGFYLVGYFLSHNTLIKGVMGHERVV